MNFELSEEAKKNGIVLKSYEEIVEQMTSNLIPFIGQPSTGSVITALIETIAMAINDMQWNLSNQIIGSNGQILQSSGHGPINWVNGPQIQGPTMYILPDGSATYSEPVDGTLFSTKNLDLFGNIEVNVWKWDGNMKHWSKLAKNDEAEQPETEVKLEEVVKCECGKEKHGFANHSTWCKKYDPNY